MAKASTTLDWCIVRLGEDHNWWVGEVSDPVRWDVDGLSIIDPRQVAHLVELIEPLRDYGFDQDVFEAAFIPFRIEKEAGAGKVRLKRVKESLIDSDEKLFALADVLDDENSPYADLLDHLTRCRVKMLNDIFKFESKLTVDEVEDEIREDQNTHFIEGKAIHTFDELTAILDYMPAGYDADGEETEKPSAEDEDDEDLPELDEAEEEKLKNDESLKWDDDEDGDDDKEEKESALQGMVRETDAKKRKALWDRVQQIFYEDVGRIKFGDFFVLALTRKGMTREEAYAVVQASSLKAWEDGLDFRELVAADSKVRNRLSAAELRERRAHELGDPRGVIGLQPHENRS